MATKTTQSKQKVQKTLSPEEQRVIKLKEMMSDGDATIVEKSPKSLQPVRPTVLLPALEKLRPYRIPSFVDPSLTQVELVKRHAEELEYTGSYQPGFILSMFALYAETREQQQGLLRALSPDIPYDKKNEVEQAAFNEIIKEHRFTWFHAYRLSAQLYYFTFAPLFRILLTPEENNGKWRIQVGVSGDELGLDKNLAYVVFDAEDYEKAMEFTSLWKAQFAGDDLKLTNAMMQSLANQVKPSVKSITLARTLQFGPFDMPSGKERTKRQMIF
jgi:hypothetical protein